LYVFQPGSGIYRTELPDFAFTGAFDPISEQSRLAMALYSQLLLRTLVTYRHVAGVAGTHLVPDLATDTGRVSADGLTWTFTLGANVLWQSPLDRSITSADVVFAFRRLDTASLQAPDAAWFGGLIVGMDGPRKAMPSRISGIETPNDRTIVFHLRRPAGDFPALLALPAAAPAPPEVAGCFSKPGDYGRYLMASGPYMVQGSDKLDISACSRLRPESGFDPTKFLTLVRNPSADVPLAYGSNYIGGVAIRIQSNTDEIVADLAAGRIDGVIVPADEVPNLDPAKPPAGASVRTFATTGLQYLFMNLLVPPFDDVHVRRAVEFVLDRSKLLPAMEQPWAGPPATHLFRAPLLGSDGAYDPYPTSLAAARTEMARSRYDHNHDGICDDSLCRNLIFVPRAPYFAFTEPLMQELATIGVVLKPFEFGTATAYEPESTPRNMLPIGLAGSPDQFIGGPRILDPLGLASLLSSTAIACQGQTNYSEVGMTRAQLRACRMPTTFTSFDTHHNTVRRSLPIPPSVDADIARCSVLAGVERARCWQAFDHHVMEDIVSWVPLRWTNELVVTGRSVDRGSATLDEFSGLVSLSHISISGYRVPLLPT
jgi:ABC-type transport system substrate-binding protein